MTPPVDIWCIATNRFAEIAMIRKNLNKAASEGRMLASSRRADRLFEEARLDLIAVDVLIEELQELTECWV